jgi:trigger factor
VLGNKEESTRLHDQIYNQKLMAFFKGQVNQEQKDIDYDEFVKIIAQKSEVNES